MSENIETLMYEIGLRDRLFRSSKGAENHIVVLTQRERLLLELIGMRDNMSIFLIRNSVLKWSALKSNRNAPAIGQLANMVFDLLQVEFTVADNVVGGDTHGVYQMIVAFLTACGSDDGSGKK